MDDQESNLDTSAVQDVAVAAGSMMSDTMRAARRMSFNADALTYRRGRPRYPDAVFELLTERCGLRPGARVLEIGAGTGLATGPLLAPISTQF